MEPLTYSQYLPPDMQRGVLDRLIGTNFVEACKSPGFKHVCTARFVFERIRRDFGIRDEKMRQLIEMYNKSGKVKALEVYELITFLDMSDYWLHYPWIDRSLLSRILDDIAKKFSEKPEELVFYPGTRKFYLAYLIDMADIILRLVNDEDLILEFAGHLHAILEYSNIKGEGRRRVQELIHFTENYIL